MEQIRDFIVEILETGYLMSIASVDEHGLCVSDLIYIVDCDLNMYFISRREFRHSRAFEKNSASSGSITAVERPIGKSTGVQFEGKVTEVKTIPEDVLKKYSKKRGIDGLWELENGEAWYKFSPTSFDVIYEPIFGFMKKKYRMIT